MNLLQAGVDITVIALWLGHEQVVDHADLPARRHDARRNERSPAPPRPAPPRAATAPPTSLLAFLEAL